MLLRQTKNKEILGNIVQRNVLFRTVYYVTPPNGVGTYCFWFGSHWRWQTLSYLHNNYLVNQRLVSYQIFIVMEIYLGHNKELIRFGDLDLIVKVTAVEKNKSQWEDICFL